MSDKIVAELEQQLAQAKARIAELETEKENQVVSKFSHAIESMNKMDSLLARVADLERWKREALTVFNSCDIQKVAKLLGMPLGVDVMSNLQPSIEKVVSRVAELEELVEGYKRTANFYRDLGITILDAKYLDPACHQGCQSLVHHYRIQALTTALVSAGDALKRNIVSVLNQPEDAKALAAITDALSEKK